MGKTNSQLLYSVMLKYKTTSCYPKAIYSQSVKPKSACYSSTEISKIRIKLKSFDLNELRDTCDAISMIANETNAVTSGPTPLPMKIKTFCVLRSPHVSKDSREHFEIRTYSRLFDIKQWSPVTVDRLMAYEVPSGVYVKVKL